MYLHVTNCFILCMWQLLTKKSKCRFVRGIFLLNFNYESKVYLMLLLKLWKKSRWCIYTYIHMQKIKLNWQHSLKTTNEISYWEMAAIYRLINPTESFLFCQFISRNTWRYFFYPKHSLIQDRTAVCHDRKSV